MPIYEYRCRACENTFEDIKKIEDRDAPCSAACVNCGKRKVVRVISTPVTGVDATVGPGSQFNELTRKMSRSLPKSAQKNLERAASLRGRKYGAQ